ncbi:MAG: thioredoxin family protein [Bacteroidia bacterium]|nr:thioredoxin family protein [Bacteroidia bacterium]
MQPSKLDFSLPSVSGKTISPASFPEARGLVIVFTCNHCPYAVAYEQRLIRFQEKYASLGYPLIAISSNDPAKYPQDNFERMKERAAQRGFNFEYCFDESQQVAHAYQAERTPHAYLLNPDLEIVYQGSIDDNWEHEGSVRERYLENAIAAFDQGNTVETARTTPVGCSIKWR